MILRFLSVKMSFIFFLCIRVCGGGCTCECNFSYWPEEGEQSVKMELPVLVNYLMWVLGTVIYWKGRAL